MKALLRLLAAALVAGLMAHAAAAQDAYPSRTIRIVVPYAPGGSTDIVARIVADKMQTLSGQPVIVLNKPGAFGMIAIDEMVKAAPDGYTLMIGNVSTNAITPVLYGDKMSFDYGKKVTAVTNLVAVPAFLLASTANDFPPKTVKELIDYAKKNPGKVRYGTVGVGSYPHYDMAWFAKRAGDLQMVAIPNKGGATGVINDMLTGSTQTAFLNVASTAGMIKAGDFRPIAVVNHARLPDYPNVPTMQESGFPDVGTIAWQGLFAPAGTPQPVLETIRTAMVDAMKSPTVKASFDKQHFNVVPTKSLADAKVWLTKEMDNWRKITSEVKIDLGK